MQSLYIGGSHINIKTEVNQVACRTRIDLSISWTRLPLSMVTYNGAPGSRHDYNPYT